MARKPPVRQERMHLFNLPDAGLFASIFCATLAAYWPALRGGLVWDDASHVTTPPLQSLHGLWRIWFDLGATQQYYPLLHSAFWTEHRLWGSAVLGYHLTNVILHAVSACLLVRIVRRLSLPGAWLAGLVFALHPVCVEAVAWISEQKSTLSGVFCLGAALVYLRFDQSRRRTQYFWALGLFVLALASKTVTATLPAALLVVFWWQRGRLDFRRDLRPLLPWFALGAAAGLFTAWVERTYIGATGADFALTWVERVLLAGRVIWFYAGKVVWPVEPHALPIPIGRSTPASGGSICSRRECLRPPSAWDCLRADSAARSPPFYSLPERCFRFWDSSTFTRLSFLTWRITFSIWPAWESSFPSAPSWCGRLAGEVPVGSRPSARFFC